MFGEEFPAEAPGASTDTGHCCCVRAWPSSLTRISERAWLSLHHVGFSRTPWLCRGVRPARYFQPITRSAGRGRGWPLTCHWPQCVTRSQTSCGQHVGLWTVGGPPALPSPFRPGSSRRVLCRGRGCQILPRAPAPAGLVKPRLSPPFRFSVRLISGRWFLLHQ